MSGLCQLAEILDTARMSRTKTDCPEGPRAPVWPVWAVLEGNPSEEIFESFSEEEASGWMAKRGLKSAGENAMRSDE